MSTVERPDRVTNILSLVGHALLLPLPTRSKGARLKWRHLKLADMDDERHLANLRRACNIGVALGRVSEGLVTIDFDHDGYVDSFLKANLPLINTLRTCASRGCNI